MDWRNLDEEGDAKALSEVVDRILRNTPTKHTLLGSNGISLHFTGSPKSTSLNVRTFNDLRRAGQEGFKLEKICPTIDGFEIRLYSKEI